MFDELIGIDTGNRDVEVARQPSGQRAVDPKVWDRLLQHGQQVIAQATRAARVSVTLAGQNRGRLAYADDAGNIGGAGAQTIFLPTSSDLRDRADCPPPDV
jgi:hypothetical protein